MMNYLDLFHGIGGFALGAYWAGMKFENHFCSDIEPYAVELYKKRFPDSIQLGDITKIDWHKLKNDYPGEWIITGGFPCQDISVAGKGKGLTDEEGNKTRSGLWYDYQRGIDILRPRFAIMENVAALLFRGMDEVLGSLSEIGYNAEWQSITAESVGAPHKRERIWIIAYTDMHGRSTAKIRQSNIQRNDNNKTRTESTEQLEGCSLQGKMAYSESKRLEAQQKRTEEFQAQERQRLLCRSNYGYDTGYWTTEPEVGRLAHGVPNRVDRLKGLGNAIVPQIAEILFNYIKPHLKN
jgi:DNA (cytosine-5)-methyltransferase 1